MPFGIRVVRRVRSIKAAIHELVSLSQRYDIEIKHINAESSIDFDDKGRPTAIYLPNRLSPTSRMWTLAHELGHLIAFLHYRPRLKKKFISPAAGSFWQLEDELQAWSVADELLIQLNPSFYNELYIRHKHEHLKTYYRYRRS